MFELPIAGLHQLRNDLEAVSGFKRAKSHLLAVHSGDKERLIPSGDVLPWLNDWCQYALFSCCYPEGKQGEYYRARVAGAYVDLINNRTPIDMVTESDLRVISQNVSSLITVADDAITWAAARWGIGGVFDGEAYRKEPKHHNLLNLIASLEDVSSIDKAVNRLRLLQSIDNDTAKCFAGGSEFIPCSCYLPWVVGWIKYNIETIGVSESKRSVCQAGYIAAVYLDCFGSNFPVDELLTSPSNAIDGHNLRFLITRVPYLIEVVNDAAKWLSALNSEGDRNHVTGGNL